MPYALPFTVIGIKDILLPALGVVTAAILGWYLTTPRGIVTWWRLVCWAEQQLKKPVEWALNGIKNGLWEVAEAWDSFRWAFSGYLQEVFDYIWQMHDWIMNYIYDYVVPRIAALERWRLDLEAWLHNYIEAKLVSLVRWRYAVANWLHTYVVPRIYVLQACINNVLDYLYYYIERVLLDTVASLEAFKRATAKAFQDVWETFRSIRAGVLGLAASLLQGITTDVLPNVWELMKNLAASLAKVMGIPAILSVVGAWFASLFNSIAKELKADMDFLDALESDWLLIAYLGITKPVLIDRADEVLNVLYTCFKQIAKPER
ncbi:MAG: hypothetical protein AB7C92_07925 [Synergistaceae bacterium]